MCYLGTILFGDFIPVRLMAVVFQLSVGGNGSFKVKLVLSGCGTHRKR